MSFEFLPAVFEHEYAENEAKAYLLNDQESYDKLLKNLKMRQQDRIEYTEYWENYSLLLVYGGTRPTSGYNIHTSAVTRIGKNMEVTALLTGPGADCAVSDMITYPLQLLAIPKIYIKEEIKLTLTPRNKPCQ